MKKIVNEQIAISDSNPIRARYYQYPHFTYPWHFHSEYELIYVEHGQGKCLVGDSIIDFSDGDVILFGSSLPHCMQDMPEESDLSPSVNGVNIQFEKNSMQYSFSHYIQFTSIYHLLQESQRGIRFSTATHPEILLPLTHIPSATGVEQIIHMLELLQSLSTCMEKTYAASPNYNLEPFTFADQKISKLIGFLNKHYTSSLTLSDASQTAMNPTAFCRYFKEKTGKTFKQYILEMRIGYACKLLAVGQMNMSQISLECGFETVTHFNRCFKKITGMTPTAYKMLIT